MTGFRGGRGGRGGYRPHGAVSPKGMFVNGTWQCDCNPRLPAVHFQVKKEGANKGKWFYACQKRQDDKTRCKFFLWDDQAKPREEHALLNNSRTEPGRADTTPSRPQRTASPPPPYSIESNDTENARKRRRGNVREPDDDFGLEDGDLEDFNQALTAAETPRKATRTETHATPTRKLPWVTPAHGMPTPQTEQRGPLDPFSTRFSRPGGSLLAQPRSQEEEEEIPSSATMPSPFDTPTPARFKDVGTPKSTENLVGDVFALLDEENVAMSNTAKASLRTTLAKYSRIAEGNNKGKEVLRLRVKAEEAKNTELTHRNNTLQAELEAVRAEVKHLQWEIENGDG